MPEVKLHMTTKIEAKNVTAMRTMRCHRHTHPISNVLATLSYDPIEGLGIRHCTLIMPAPHLALGLFNAQHTTICGPHLVYFYGLSLYLVRPMFQYLCPLPHCHTSILFFFTNWKNKDVEQ